MEETNKASNHDSTPKLLTDNSFRLGILEKYTE